MVLLIISSACFGQQPAVTDLSQLVGKRVIVQRIPLCQPGTFNMVFSYAGKQAKVNSIKPSSYVSQEQLSKLPESVRAKLQDMQNSATILVQFEDGTSLDSCYAIRPDQVFNYFELAPGESLTMPSSSQSSRSTQIQEPSLQAKDLPSEEQMNIARNSAGGKWLFDSSKDQLTDVPKDVFIIDADSAIRDGITTATPTLSIVCSSGHFHTAILDAGIVLSAESHDSTKLKPFQPPQQYVKVRLDKKIELMSWDMMNSTDSLAIGKHDLEKILKASDVRIQFSAFTGLAEVAAFEPAGLDREKLDHSCGLRF